MGERQSQTVVLVGGGRGGIRRGGQRRYGENVDIEDGRMDGIGEDESNGGRGVRCSDSEEVSLGRGVVDDDAVEGNVA